MRSSRPAVDLIVAHEVTSKDYYIRHYQRPEWPGVASGVTVGIGYDLGYNTAETILHDWKDFLTPGVIHAMQRCAGVTGGNAKNLLGQVRSQILVPWDAAMAVFMNITMPKFEAALLRAIPAAINLPAGCFGVLTSITYNRGASYTKAGDRYKEMRNIRALVTSGNYAAVSHEIRAMKRLWPGVAGLLRRRDEEATLWDRSLQAAAVPAPTPAPAPVRPDTGDDRHDGLNEVTSEGNAPINVQPETGEYNIETELVQKTLISMNYHEVGNPNGIYGGKTVAGIAAFMTDRGKDPNRGLITQELKDELSKAKSEGWSRPIAPARANATAKDIENKVPAVKEHWWNKLWAIVVGAPAAAGALFKQFFGDYNDPASTIYQVKSFFTEIPAEFYLLVIVAIAGAIFYKAKKAQDATVEAYRRGEIN